MAVEILSDMAATMDSQNSLWALNEKLAVYEECLSIIESLGQWEVEQLLNQVSEFTEPLKTMGLGAISMNNVELELEVWKVSLRFCMATGCADSVRHGELLIRVGVALSKQVEQDSALIMQHYDKADAVFSQLGRQNTHWYAILVHNMGVVLGQQGDRERELSNYEKAVATYRGLKMTQTETFTSILYELAASRTDRGDKEGGREAFLEAERVFVQSPKLQSRMRSHYVGQYGLSRRAAGDLAGAIHAFEIAVQVHEKAQTLRTEGGRAAKKNLKEAETIVASLPKEDRRQIARRIEVLRWPSEPQTDEELEAGVYLQRAGR
ncbi:unnamed protein product [Symbiodinium pilosum]|uniref:MalT-like TPR region domain-containing protein n=1 Tax=Symbiodinium pilosum TaxID=2952 RepID=A0A812YAT3_SYMPI|nr:unnamed protein product [Symbiodinium pilosum]